jgi:hypothetical protein
VTDVLPDASRNQSDDQKEKELAAVAVMVFVEAATLVIQLVKFGPEMQGSGEWYRGAWERVRGLFRRNRESDAVLCPSRMQDANGTLVLGARDNVTQLEEGLLRARDDVRGHESEQHIPGSWIS